MCSEGSRRIERRTALQHMNHARASLCAIALIATTCSVLAHFFRNQKNTIPPSATPFIRASSPATGLDVVRLTSATSVTLFVSP